MLQVNLTLSLKLRFQLKLSSSIIRGKTMSCFHQVTSDAKCEREVHEMLSQ